MCGPTTREASPGTAIAAVFRNHSPVGCIYFRHAADGEAVVLSVTAVSEVEKPLFVSNEHVLNVRIHKYGTYLADSDNPVLHHFALSNSKTKICCNSQSILSVSEGGVIGRGLSIVDEDGVYFGSGIIGWN
jgi:hypothetical protein